MEVSLPQRSTQPPDIIPQAFPPCTSIVANHGAKKRAEPKASGGSGLSSATAEGAPLTARTHTQRRTPEQVARATERSSPAFPLPRLLFPVRVTNRRRPRSPVPTRGSTPPPRAIGTPRLRNSRHTPSRIVGRSWMVRSPTRVPSSPMSTLTHRLEGGRVEFLAPAQDDLFAGSHLHFAHGGHVPNEDVTPRQSAGSSRQGRPRRGRGPEVLAALATDRGLAPVHCPCSLLSKTAFGNSEIVRFGVGW